MKDLAMNNNHSITKVFVHFVFVTKFRKDYNFFDDDLEIIRSVSERLMCPVVELNSAKNHVHLLVELHPSQSIANFACSVKACSSGSFARKSSSWPSWQTGYYASSVSDASLETVKKYILEQ
jgi:putative transposase